MKEYVITYKTGNTNKECTVIATGINNALKLVEVANRNNDFFEEIIDCVFIKNIDEMYIEKVD